MNHRLIIGDAKQVLQKMDEGSINLAVTSPPYFQQRNYLIDGQIGQEETDEKYIESLSEIFAEVYRVLDDSGSFYLNIADTRSQKTSHLIPERVLLRLKEIGFLVRNRICWVKTTTITSFAPDRYSDRFEFIYFLTKTKKNYFDAKSVSVRFAETTLRRLEKLKKRENLNLFDPLKHKVYTEFEISPAYVNEKIVRRAIRKKKTHRHPIDVWPFASASFAGSHEAVFPLELPMRAILASSKPGDWILDPFVGSGTTMLAADLLGRNSIGIDLNPISIKFVKERLNQQRLDKSHSLEICIDSPKNKKVP